MDFTEHLRKFFKHARRQGEVCEKILGDNIKVNKFSMFWQDHGEDLMLVNAKALYDFTKDESFTESELAAYKKGLADGGGVFFQQCYKEMQKLAQIKKVDTK